MITFDANWSSSKELKEKLYGKLEIGDFGEVKLFLPFAFGKEFESIVDLDTYSFLFGIVGSNKLIVLENCRETYNNLGKNAIISAEKAYIFDSIQSKESPFTKVVVSFDRLGVWLNRSEVHISFDTDESDQVKNVYAIASPSVIWEGKTKDFTLRFLCDINVRNEIQNLFSIKSSFFVEIIPNIPILFEEPERIEETISLIQKINDLLCICIGEDVYTNSIKFKGEGCEASLYKYGIDSNCYNKKDKINQSIDFPLLMDCFEELMTRWLDNYSKLEGSLKIIENYYFDTGRRKRMIDIPTFIKNVCVGIESYSRNMREIKIEDDVEVYELRLKRIMEAVQENQKDAKWLKQKLTYANEASLRKRLKIIFSEISNEFDTIKKYLQLYDKKKYELTIDRIVKTRNFYTHYDLSSQDLIYNDAEAYNISVILVELLRVILLKSCNVPLSIINKSWETNQEILNCCAAMGFITLTPLAISTVIINLFDGLFWLRSSYFKEDKLTYDTIMRLLTENDISCFITIGNYKDNRCGFYGEDKKVKRYLVKLNPQGIELGKTKTLFDIIDENIESKNKIAIWASQENIRAGIISAIKAKYKTI